ncbi:MAG: xylulokinase [Anaerolineae bacterium]
MQALLGIDLGTSSVKVAVFEAEELQVLGSASAEYPVLHPRPDTAEQDPADWWQAVVCAVRAALAIVPEADVRGIGLAGQMHGVVCVDVQGNPVAPAIIWADARAADLLGELVALQARSSATLPGPPAAGFAAATFLWLARHAPEVLWRMHRWMLPKDYIRFRLTGQVSTDPGDVSATWLYDITRQAWADDVRAYCGLAPSQMPEVLPSESVAGLLTPDAAAALGLPVGVPVVSGTADLAAGALGHGIVTPGHVLVIVGSGGQVFVPVAEPQPDPDGRYYVFQHGVAGRWYAQAAMLSAGLALRWLRDVLGLQDVPDAYARLSALAGEVAPGAEGLIFLPYLAGERTPHMDPDASGVFFGLRLHHGAGHLARAIMEGVAYGLKDCLALVAPPKAPVVLSGGVTRSAVWSQILSDVWGRPLRLADPAAPHGCRGAALLAGLGTGAYSDLPDALRRIPSPDREVQPVRRAVYEDGYDRFRRLYALLAGEMHGIAGH